MWLPLEVTWCSLSFHDLWTQHKHFSSPPSIWYLSMNFELVGDGTDEPKLRVGKVWFSVCISTGSRLEGWGTWVYTTNFSLGDSDFIQPSASQRKSSPFLSLSTQDIGKKIQLCNAWSIFHSNGTIWRLWPWDEYDKERLNFRNKSYVVQVDDSYWVKVAKIIQKRTDSVRMSGSKTTGRRPKLKSAAAYEWWSVISTSIRREPLNN